MIWNVIRIHTTNEATDILGSILFDLGFDGIEVQDNVQLSEEDRKKMFIDFLPEVDENDKTAVITCYTDGDCEPYEKIEAIKEACEDYKDFVDFGALSFETGVTEDKDWINNWKKYFKAFAVDEDIIIKPTWEPWKDEYKDRLVVEIDPGTAFGTGSHETTKLVILNIKKYLKKGDCLLDIGTGSGILSIIGYKLGASSCIGTDIDPIAVDVAKENSVLNGIELYEGSLDRECPGKVAMVYGNLLEECDLLHTLEERKFPIVVANILADVIIPLAPVVKRLLLPGGIFISSGIIEMKKEEVKEALLRCGYEILAETRMKDWYSFVVKLPG